MAFPPTNPTLARALTERAYNDPTPVQTAVLAPEAVGQDLLVSAQTGSGKTVAFGLAIGTTLLGDNDSLGNPGDPVALVIAPTRELALQVQRELTWLYQYAGARIVSCVGGMDPQMERRQLNSGCHIVVGTPGRLRDHLERGSLRLAGLKAAVLDEADEMLDLGFREDLEFILAATPDDRRTLLFSATLPKAIVTLAREFQRDAFRIATSAGERHADIEYRAIRVAAHDTEHVIVNSLRFFDSPSALVFCNTREGVRRLHATLLERGFSTVSLSGEFSQKERNHALQSLRDGRARVCVATDVAARGIDLPGLDLVIHADLPNDSETLQHRSGRTGRAGRKGLSILVVPPSRRRRAEQLLSAMRLTPVWSNPPTAEEIRKRDDVRLLESLLQMDAGQPDDLVLAKQLLAQRSAEEIASAFVRMHRAQLPAPEDIAEPTWDDSRGKAPSWKKDGAGSRGSYDPARGPAHGPAHGPGSRGPTGPTTWFSLDVGRTRKADPKWLIPEICRQGGITKREIGAIKIFDGETRFEIDSAVATEFADKTAKFASTGDIHITSSSAPAAMAERGGERGGERDAPRKPYGKPSGKPGGKPFAKSGKPAWKSKSHEKSNAKPWTTGAGKPSSGFHKGPRKEGAPKGKPHKHKAG